MTYHQSQVFINEGISGSSTMAKCPSKAWTGPEA